MNQRIILYYADIIVNSTTFPLLFDFVRRECLISKEDRVLKATDNFYLTMFKIYWSTANNS
jgi:hypothetical protein